MKLILTVVMMVVVSCSTVRGGLKQVTRPLLKLVEPLAEGVDIGLSGSNKEYNDALEGTVARKSANSVGDLAANAVQGVGQSVAAAPESLLRAVDALQNNSGLLGNLLGTIVGGSNESK